MRKVLAGVVIVVVSLFIIPVSMVLAQDVCEGNFDTDVDVDGTDAAVFKSDFGRSAFKNPCPPNGPAPVPKTGSTGCWDENGDPYLCAYSLGDEQVVIHGQDGAWRKGVTWADPRFTDNGDGTVADNLTGLIWMKNANCFGERTWMQAIDDCDGLSAGYCGLTDGSNVGDWRLSNRFELESLLDLGNNFPALPDGHPFINVQNVHPSDYWSSTTYSVAAAEHFAWFMSMSSGSVVVEEKINSNFVWCVRGGQ